jgi:hypothetical protein
MSDEKRTTRQAVEEMTRRAYQSGGTQAAKDAKASAIKAATRVDRPKG